MLRIERFNGVWYWSCEINGEILFGQENTREEVFAKLAKLKGEKIS